MTGARASRLRELRLHGFKTFADPTRFVFESGVNAVIGPNGSGKSNMADGVRWVLGEQSNRSLRTRRADDVIFAGSQQRKPTGMAEVILTLDNRDGWLPIDFTEVTIGRRAYRSGESEYLLNGARARLRDVVDLLAAGRLGASSLVVVGQGTVDAALSLRPEERRQLFEEAAGVKNLQVRANESLARLARAEENLTRVADLLSELKPQVRRLALQAQHQEEHDALQQRARAVVLELLRRREGDLRERLGDARRRSAAADAAAEALRTELAGGRQRLAAAEEAYWTAERAARTASEAREETREARVRLESRAEASGARIAELAAAVEAAERDRRDAEQELRTLGGSSEASDGTASLRADAETADRRWRTALDAVAAADGSLIAAETELAEARRRDARELAANADLEERAARRRSRIERLQQELAVATEQRTKADEARDAALAAGAQTAADLAAARSSLARATQDAEPLQASALEARRRATTLAEQLATVQAQLEGLSDPDAAGGGGRLGVRLAASGWQALLDALDAPDEAWAAIEAAVGGELGEAFLWRDDDPTRAARETRGTARLVDSRGAPSAAERDAGLRAVGARRTLDEWISAGRGESPSLRGADGVVGLFTRVAVAEDLDALLGGWRALPAGWCAVTPAGDLADARGVLTVRGRADPPGGAAARRAARRHELAASVSNLEAEHGSAADAAAHAVAAAAAGQRRLADARRAMEVAEDAEARTSTAARDAGLAADRAAAEEQRLAAALSGERASEERPIPPVRPPIDHEDLVSRVRAAREAAGQAALEREAARAAWEAARAALDAAERSLTTGRSRRSSLEARLEQLRTSQDAAKTAHAGLEAAHAGELAAAADARQADESAAEARTRAEQARETARGELLRLEREGSGAAGRLADLDRAVQAAALEVLRAEEALATLDRERALELETLAGDTADDAGALQRTEDPGWSTEPALAAELASIDVDGLEAERRRVRRTLAQIGSVNPFAVEEHREQSARLEEVTAQERDLGAAIEATRELISRLEAEIEERFGAAFAAISERFDAFCRLLFAGGSAALERVDGEGDEEGAGIEIVVRPPGKRPQRLAMLSGGERALTGVALLFAMLSVNPVPFCILDEVDAALDEANIGRFAEALRMLAEEIDFVVITHNRATIEVADTIYGVTMSDAAVSRVISVRLADVPMEVTA